MNEFVNSMPIITVPPRKEIHLFKEYSRDRAIVYKARPNEGKLPWQFLKDISIVPEDKKQNVNRGRLNKPGERIFYCSNDMRVSCLESISKGLTLQPESKYLTVGAWKIIEPLNLAKVYYSNQGLEHFAKNNKELYDRKSEYREWERNDAIGQLKQNFKGEELEKAIVILDFFSDEIGRIDIRNGYDYMLCNYFADHIFHRTKSFKPEDKIDGILYPSIPFSYQGDNIAFTENGFKKLKFISAAFVKVIFTEGANWLFFEKGIQADENGQLLWNNV